MYDALPLHVSHSDVAISLYAEDANENLIYDLPKDKYSSSHLIVLFFPLNFVLATAHTFSYPENEAKFTMPDFSQTAKNIKIKDNVLWADCKGFNGYDTSIFPLDGVIENHNG